jgi:hypothetical protein
MMRYPQNSWSVVIVTLVLWYTPGRLPGSFFFPSFLSFYSRAHHFCHAYEKLSLGVGHFVIGHQGVLQRANRPAALML